MNESAAGQRRLLEEALSQLKQARAQLAAARQREPESIAVLGAAVRAPGDVDDLASLWQVLSAGTDAVSPWSDDPQGRRNGDRPTGRWAGLLPGIDGFDAEFFGISQAEADHMDPQQRLVLETAWEAMEDAGLPAELLRDRPTGVYLGLYGADYLMAQLAGQAEITAYTGPGGAHSIAANRLSYLLDLRGPSLVVDTACSSSLVALHLACRALRNRECDLALVGGVNIILSESMMAATEKVLPMASGGRCRAFDAAADGIVRSEGCGIVLLERLSDARETGRRIRAVVRGSAVNHNGRSNGLTAPSPKAQAHLLRQALTDARAEACDVQYIEAHGTGTQLGDPIEVAALSEVYGAGVKPCAIGSVKTNFGHQEAAAGIIGLLKTMLVLEHGQVPPNLHLERLNPEITLDGTRLTVPTAPVALPGDDRRLAAVSSFGFGGTNAHVILQAPPVEAPATGPPTGGLRARQPQHLLLPLSARSSAALSQLAQAYTQRLAGLDTTAAAELCAAAADRRSHHPYRLAVDADSPPELARELAGVRAEFVRAQPPGRRVAFVFSGQGTQWAGMGRDLLADEPVVRLEAQACDAAVRELAGWSVLEELHQSEPHSRLHESERGQVCIAVLQLGLAALWRSWGIEPYAVTGHSMGEIVAACVAGTLSRREALELLITRSRIAEESARGGAMAAIALPVKELERLIADVGGRCAVAAVNGPRSTVVAGDLDPVAQIEAAAAAQGAKAIRLPVDYAFHSPLLDGCDTLLTARVGHLSPRPGRLPQYSTVTGDHLPAADLSPAHWGRNLRERVLFSDAVSALARDGVTCFLEIGPHPVLLRDISATLEAGPSTPGVRATVVGSLRRDASAQASLEAALGALYLAGLDVTWSAVLPPPARHVALPPYPWQRRRHWLNLSGTPDSTAPSGSSGDVSSQPDPGFAEQYGPDQEQPFLAYVRAQLADALDLNSDEPFVAVDSRLDALGLTSLAMVELKNRIERDFAVTVPLRVLLEDSTPLTLARAIAALLNPALSEDERPALAGSEAR